MGDKSKKKEGAGQFAPASGKSVLLLAIAAQSAHSAGKVLRLLDTDDVGPDDVGGKIADLFGTALDSFAAGDLRNYNSYLKAIADVIYAQQGLTPPTS